jgi:hypothetical protein
LLACYLPASDNNTVFEEALHQSPPFVGHDVQGCQKYNQVSFLNFNMAGRLVW